MAAPATSGQLRTTLADMQVGDYIPFRYVASSGVAGTFSELGTCTATEISVAGAAAPNGKAYFLKVAPGLLICDRVVQHSISWDTLNAAGLIEGKVNIFGVSASNQSGSYPATNVVDTILGGPNGYWDANVAAPVNITITSYLGEPISNYSLGAVGSPSWVDRSPRSWTVEGSDDGTSWTQVDTQSNIGWTAGEIKKFTLSQPVNYKIFRFNITAGNGGATICLKDIYFNDKNPAFAGLIRSLSGGCAYADASGNKSTTNQSKGAWPTNNEWDKYIVNSDLGGKITEGDDNVWHWGISNSWCQETSILAIGTNAYRVVRGRYALNFWNWFLSDSTYGSDPVRGFRPVLQYVEAPATTLFY